MTSVEFDKFISHFGEAMNRRDLGALFAIGFIHEVDGRSAGRRGRGR